MTPVSLGSGQSHTFKCTFDHIEGFKGFEDNVQSFGEVTKEFRWSDDDTNWSYWSTLNRENLKNVSTDTDSTIYFECKYTLVAGVQNNALIYDVTIYPKCADTTACKKLESTGSTTTESMVQITPGTFSPYSVNQASNLYTKLAESVSSMFGHQSTYFRATPVDKSGDVIFKEWSLLNVEEPKCIQILINNNEMPDLNLQFNSYGIEYQQPFEVEILKSAFQETFGVDSVPQKGDIVYIPLMSTRLFEVTSSTPNRGFMYQEISWKCNLSIYKPKSNRDLSKKAVETLDQIMKNQVYTEDTQSDEGLFSAELDKEIENLTVPQVLNPHIGSINDPIREYVSDLMNIVSFDLDNHGVKVANSYYDLSTLLDNDCNIVTNARTQKKEEFAVIYDKFQNFKANQDFALTCWLSVKDYKARQEMMVKGITKKENGYVLTTDKILAVSEGDYVDVSRQGRLGFYAKVVSVEDNKVTVSISEEMVSSLSEISANWLFATGYTIKKTLPATIIDGYDNVYDTTEMNIGDSVIITSSGKEGVIVSIGDGTYCVDLGGMTISVCADDITKKSGGRGFKIEMFCGRYILMTQNNTPTLYSLKEKLDSSKWYAFALNFSAKFKQAALSIYTIKEGTGIVDSELEKVFFTAKNISSVSMSLKDTQFILRPCYLKLTNVRIYKELIPEDKISAILNQYVISDSSNAILVDNAAPMTRLAYIGNVK